MPHISVTSKPFSAPLSGGSTSQVTVSDIVADVTSGGSRVHNHQVLWSTGVDGESVDVRLLDSNSTLGSGGVYTPSASALAAIEAGRQVRSHLVASSEGHRTALTLTYARAAAPAAAVEYASTVAGTLRAYADTWTPTASTAMFSGSARAANWGSSIANFTGVSFSNPKCTLIGRRHGISVGHYRPSVGGVVKFITVDDDVVEAIVSGYTAVGRDVGVVSFTAPVPASIAACSVLRHEVIASKSPTFSSTNVANGGFPLVAAAGNGNQLLALSVAAEQGQGDIVYAPPTKDAWLPAWRQFIPGDSGSPVLYPVNGLLQPLLIGTVNGGGDGSGRYIPRHYDAISAIVPDLTTIDLSGFTTF